MSESVKESIKDRPQSLIKIGNYYLKQMKDLADAWFKEKLMMVQLNKDKAIFDIWVRKGVDEEAVKQFEKKYASTEITIWDEIKRKK